MAIQKSESLFNTSSIEIEIIIKEGRLQEAITLARQIPEFLDPYPRYEYKKRLTGKKHLILIASINGTAAGFKIGYDRDSDGSFYSWLGGVLPEYRKTGIAQRLADSQENWILTKGYHTIRMKTRNKHRAMLHFLIKNGFYITAVDPREPSEETRILLEKQLSRGNLPEPYGE